MQASPRIQSSWGSRVEPGTLARTGLGAFMLELESYDSLYPERSEGSLTSFSQTNGVPSQKLGTKGIPDKSEISPSLKNI
jgi:hypothetical protein